MKGLWSHQLIYDHPIARIDALSKALITPQKPIHIHNSFRFPARLHHRVSAQIIDEFSKRGDAICDPFVGSGTNLVEAATSGRQSFGLDIDPLSVFVARAKVSITPRSAKAFKRFSDDLLVTLASIERTPAFYASVVGSIDSGYKASRTLASLQPGFRELIETWFRPYVIEDLVRIRNAVVTARVADPVKRLALMAFANAIRSCSNADPAPVSGLEYTSRMRRLDAQGRVINPYAVYRRKLLALVRDSEDFAQRRQPGCEHRVYHRDAAESWRLPSEISLITCSPPYLNAVEYSRRHKLEMAWLGLINGRKEFVKLSGRYIGRRTGGSQAIEQQPCTDTLLESLRRELIQRDYRRARAFLAYCVKMSAVFKSAEASLVTGGLCAVVIGRNRVCDLTIPMDELLPRLAGSLHHVKTSNYSLRDRYMSYERRNGADIGTEYIVILEKR